MFSITKIFRFEMGHAINGYSGMCKYIHGHSYKLHVTVTTSEVAKTPFPAPGFVLDFKDLKKIVEGKIVNELDHALVLSQDYIDAHPNIIDDSRQNLKIWEYEPSAENILYYIREVLKESLPKKYTVLRMKLWETANSFAEWENTNF